MKKLTIIALSVLLGACQQFGTTSSQTVAKTGVDQRDFVGGWQCQIDDGKIITASQMQLGEDGHILYVGNLQMPKDDPLLQFEVKRTGSWTYANNALSLNLGNSQVKAAHTESMLAKIQSTAENQQLEKEYFAAIQKSMAKSDKEQKPLVLNVSNFSQLAFNISLQTKNGTRTGLCQRSQG